MDELEELRKLNQDVQERTFQALVTHYDGAVTAIDKCCIVAFGDPSKTNDMLKLISEIVDTTKEMLNELRLGHLRYNE